MVLVSAPVGPSSGETYLSIRINGDTGANYSEVVMWGNGSSTGSNTYTFTGRIGVRTKTTNTSNGNYICNFMDYSATDKHKTILLRESSAGLEVGAFAARWANTNAITTITVFLENNANFSEGSTFTLYGIVS